MWTSKNRARYDRSKLRYPSDLTDDEWGLVEPLIPPGKRKKIKGKKRHILVDTVGLLLHAVVHPADIQDRDGGVLVMATLFGMFPFLRRLFVDSGYQGPKFANALAKGLPHLDIEIVKRSDQVSGFVVLPKRWIVERTIAWLNILDGGRPGLVS
jgi:transposase